VLEVHGQSDFREFLLNAPAADANYALVQSHGHMAKSLDQLQPDAVFLPGWADRCALAALRWCQATGTPAIAMSESTRFDSIADHETDPGRPVKRRWWREAVKRRIVPQFSAALVGGTPHREYIIELGLAPDRVFDGYDAVDNEHFARGADAACEPS